MAGRRQVDHDRRLIEEEEMLSWLSPPLFREHPDEEVEQAFRRVMAGVDRVTRKHLEKRCGRS